MKSLVRIVLAVVWVVGFVPRAASATQADTQSVPIEEEIKKLTAEHERLVAALEQTAKSVHEISAVFGKYSQDSRLVPDENSAQKSSEAERALNEVTMKHPYALLLHFMHPKSRKDSERPNAKDWEISIQEGVRAFRKSPPSECFDTKQNIYRDTKTCRERLSQSCGPSLGSEGGQLYVEELTSEIELNKVPIANYTEYYTQSGLTGLAEARPPVRELSEYKFNYCRIASRAGARVAPTHVLKKVDTSPAWMQPVRFVLRDFETIKSNCLNAWPTYEQQARAMDLATDKRLKYPMKLWLEWMNLRIQNCEKSIWNICQSVYFAKDKAILAYATAGCETREVTAGDVQKDLEEFERLEITEAIRLKHTYLLDIINACQLAYEKGMSWKYEAPTVEKSCIRKKK